MSEVLVSEYNFKDFVLNKERQLHKLVVPPHLEGSN